MLVFSYAVELDATDAKAEGYEALVKEAAKAYRSRAACAEARADRTSARRDIKRAETLEAKVKSPDSKDSVTVRNEWTEPVTLVIAGATYTVPAGESKTMPAPSGSFSYEMSAGTHRVSGTIEAGKTYRIKSPSPTGASTSP
jgi:hypothetical protein